MCLRFPTLAFEGADVGGFSSMKMTLTNQMNQQMKTWTPAVFASGVQGARANWIALLRAANANNQPAADMIKPTYEKILDSAQNYYGKTYMM